jgi:catechol-2,3-dioxygenase
MTVMPEATGLFETHLTVSYLERSIAFYRDVVGLPLALELPECEAAFLWIGGTCWRRRSGERLSPRKHGLV